MDYKAYTAYEPRPHGEAGTVLASLQVVCAWCQQHIVWHRVQPPLPFPISYSICGRCYAVVARSRPVNRRCQSTCAAVVERARLPPEVLTACHPHQRSRLAVSRSNAVAS